MPNETKQIESRFLNYDKPFVMIDSTSTYVPCKHLNGFYTTIPKFFGGRKAVFCCNDCLNIIDRKTLKKV